MAMKLKPFEYIFRFESDPKSTGLEVTKMEEIIRCRNCLYFDRVPYVAEFCKLDGHRTNTDEFCSSAILDETKGINEPV